MDGLLASTVLGPSPSAAERLGLIAFVANARMADYTALARCEKDQGKVGARMGEGVKKERERESESVRE